MWVKRSGHTCRVLATLKYVYYYHEKYYVFEVSQLTGSDSGLPSMGFVNGFLPLSVLVSRGYVCWGLGQAVGMALGTGSTTGTEKMRLVSWVSYHAGGTCPPQRLNSKDIQQLQGLTIFCSSILPLPTANQKAEPNWHNNDELLPFWISYYTRALFV